MNRYILFRAFQRYKKNFKWYSFISLQICIAIIMVNFFSTISFSINKQYKFIKSKAENSLIQLDVKTRDSNGFDNNIPNKKKYPIINFLDYKNIKKKYINDIDIMYVYKKKLTYVINRGSNSNISELYLLFVSDEFFKLVYPNKTLSNFNNMNTIIIGNEAKNILINGKLIKDMKIWYKNVDFNKNLIAMNHNKTFKIVDSSRLYSGMFSPIKTILLDRYNNSLMDPKNFLVPLDNSIILPIAQNIMLTSRNYVTKTPA